MASDPGRSEQHWKRPSSDARPIATMLRDFVRKQLRKVVMKTGRGFGLLTQLVGETPYDYADFLRQHGGLHSMGRDVMIVRGAEFTDPAYVKIGNNVCLSKCVL